MSELFEQRARQIEHEHPYLAAFLDGVPWKLVPLYILASFLIAWLSILTFWFAGQHAPEWDAASFMNSATALMFMIAAVPFALGAMNAAARWYVE